MKRFAMMVVGALAVLAFSSAGAIDMVEGKQYTRIKNAQAPEKGRKIEVIEFFSYGCPHCNDLEPFLQSWMKTVPADVQFVRVPVTFQTQWIALPKIYYTLEAMGEAQRLSPEVFKAIHVSNIQLNQDKAFFDWAASKGLDRAKVADIYSSFAIDSKLKRAKVLAQDYNVQAVPTLIVDGKFMTSSSALSGGHSSVPAALDALIVKARAERGA
jgi:thiol:disulfide interchange protein DsbA